MMEKLQKLRTNRFLNIIVINLRYIIGLGFLPSGVVKIMDRPFTLPENQGIFVDYLDALYTTGYYYNMIGVMQVLAAILLITQRFSTLGAFLFLPIIYNIAVLTLSTIGSLTPIIACLMLLGVIFLLLWDYYKWINIFKPDNQQFKIPSCNGFPTYSPFHVYTGIALIIIPALLIILSWEYGGIFSFFLILIAGNILSELKFPVLRPTAYKKS